MHSLFPPVFSRSGLEILQVKSDRIGPFCCSSVYGTCFCHYAECAGAKSVESSEAPGVASDYRVLRIRIIVPRLWQKSNEAGESWHQSVLDIDINRGVNMLPLCVQMLH